MKAVVTSNFSWLASFVQSISTVYSLDSGHKILEGAAGDLGVFIDFNLSFACPTLYVIIFAEDFSHQ